jgi:hypothetical protein
MNAQERAQLQQHVADLAKRVSELEMLIVQLELLQDIDARVRDLERRPGPDSFSTENKLSINAEGVVE